MMQRQGQAVLPTIFVIAVSLQLSYQQTPCTVNPTMECDCYNTNGKLQIICRDKQLTAIPAFTQTGLTYDEITFGSSQPTGCTYCNKISTVPKNAFSNLSVKKIILTQNAVSKYDTHAFAGLENILEDLELEGDGMNALPNGAIRNLTNLQQLHLEHFNQQSMTQSNTLSPFPQLTKLTFQNIKNLNNIDYNAFLMGTNQPKFPILNTFHLKDIPTLTVLPVFAIEELQQLTELEISGTGISQINRSSFKTLDKLINLHITYNSNLHIIENSSFNGIYDTLEFLFLGFNNLRDLSSLKAGNWTELTQVNLQDNPVGTIPASTFSLLGKKLAYLNLESCQLTSIDSSMFNGLEGLHTLVLSKNQIQNLPASVFQNMPGLTELRLNRQKNPLTVLVNSFDGIENSLNHLFIGHNTVNVATFWSLISKLPNLLELSAANLNLRAIPDNAFKDNAKINILDLESNGITFLQDGSFYRLRDSLEVLILSSNSISSISKCVLNGFKKLRQLQLSGNMLDCDCSMRWLFDWVQAQTDKYLASFLLGPCTSPPALANKYFHNISSRNDLHCDSTYAEPVCIDIYPTTSISTTTTAITITSATNALIPTRFTLNLP